MTERSRRPTEGEGARRGGLVAALVATALLPLVLTLPRMLGERALAAPRLPASQESDATARSIHAAEHERAAMAALDATAIAAEFRRGRAAHFAPEVELGAPLLASTHAGPFFPTHVARLLVAPAVAAPLLAGLALFLAGLGMFAFLRGRGLDATAAILGAVALQASGSCAANLHAPWRVETSAALLWLAAAFTRRTPAGIAVSSACAFLAGAPRLAALGAAFVLVAVGARALHAPRAAGRAAVALLLGLFLAAPQLLPEFTVFSASALAPLTDDALARLALGLRDLVSAALPSGGLAAPLDGRVFLGVPAVVLAVAGVVGAPRRALTPLAVAAAAVGFAANFVPFAGAVRSLPGADHLAPRDALAALAFAVAWLAAIGVDAALRGVARAWLAAFVLLGAGALAALVASIGSEGDDQSRLRAFLAWAAATAFALLPARIAASRANSAARRTAWVFVVALVLAGGAFLAKERSPAREGEVGELADRLRVAAGDGEDLRHLAFALPPGRDLAATMHAARRAGLGDLSARRPFPDARLRAAAQALERERPGTFLSRDPLDPDAPLVLADERAAREGVLDDWRVGVVTSVERLSDSVGLLEIAATPLRVHRRALASPAETTVRASWRPRELVIGCALAAAAALALAFTSRRRPA